MPARYVVGIDLGTTNTACAWVDTRAGRDVRVLALPQLTAFGRVEPRTPLPSCVYLAGRHDVPAGAFDLPWAQGREFCVGWLAREQGALVPGRLVTSAKSWICHGGVDRGAAILPWGGAEDVARISPVEASARVLGHVVDAWGDTMDEPLREQDVVLTVPASFDTVARELTLEAAEAAGLARDRLRLLEEPQAAFYAWLVDHEADWQARVQRHPLVLVVDVGGGTSDFSLVLGEIGRGELGLTRVAVGDHLLLGGDNMDVALARQVEDGLGQRLDAARFHALVGQCRAAKETMLADETVRAVAVTVPGRGGKVVGGAVRAQVDRAQVLDTVLEGFFPETDAGDRPARGVGVGIREFGLPYASDPAITRHIADFLARQRAAAGETGTLVRPDAILFNGGACEPHLVRERIATVVGRWHAPDGSWRPTIVESESLQLAVARGAAYYGLVRRGAGIRIGSGTARTYYLGLEAEDGDERRVLCVVPRGMEEGETVRVERELELRTNRAVSFPLLTATDRTGEAAGDVITVRAGELTEMAPIRTVLRFGRKLEERALPVDIEARLSEIGTLEVWCASRETEHRWRLEFRLRDDAPAGASESAGLVVDQGRVETAGERLADCFEGEGDPVQLVRVLEATFDAARDAWSLLTIRALWDRLWEFEAARGRSDQHEARWLNLAGYLLRPGFGHAGDEVRIGRLWRVLGTDLRFPRAAQGRAEQWNLWKRVAGGLSAQQQQLLVRRVSPVLLKRGKPGGPRPGPQEVREMWHAVGSCERLGTGVRAELAVVAVRAAERGKASDQELWALGRLAARVPLYGPLNCVIAPATAAEIAERLLAAKRWPRPERYAFVLAQIARRTGDRTRDVEPALAERVAVACEERGGSRRAATLVREIVALDSSEQARLLDESLPAGLSLGG